MNPPDPYVQSKLDEARRMGAKFRCLLVSADRAGLRVPDAFLPMLRAARGDDASRAHPSTEITVRSQPDNGQPTSIWLPGTPSTPQSISRSALDHHRRRQEAAPNTCLSRLR